jgi:hypothetical protein
VLGSPYLRLWILRLEEVYGRPSPGLGMSTIGVRVICLEVSLEIQKKNQEAHEDYLPTK